jgi:hypothetical protein
VAESSIHDETTDQIEQRRGDVHRERDLGHRRRVLEPGMRQWRLHRVVHPGCGAVLGQRGGEVQCERVVGQRDACSNQACVSGVCNGSCTPGAVECSGNGAATCSASGMWGSAVACTSGTCTNGVCSGLEVEYQVGPTASGTTAIGSTLWVLNNGSTAVSLSGLTVCYYVTIVGEVPIADVLTNITWANTGPIAGGAQSGFNDITMKPVAITPVTEADTCIQFTLGTGSDSLAAGYVLQFSWTAQNYQSLNFNQTNDYSFNAADTSETSTTKIVLFQNSTVLWGVVP